MTDKGNCAKCVELWRDYGAATREHVSVLKAQEAAAGVDPQRFRELDEMAEIAATRRDAARAAVKLHMATEHDTEEPPSRAMRA